MDDFGNVLEGSGNPIFLNESVVQGKGNFSPNVNISFRTRMHSSRMRTEHLFTVCLLGGGGVGGASTGGASGIWWVHPGGAFREVHLGEGVHLGCILTPVNRMTDARENITFPHTPYAVGNKKLIA